MNFLLDYVSSIFLLKYSILYTKVMEVKHIVQGYINDVFNINENISKNRLKICYTSISASFFNFFFMSTSI